MNDNENSPSPHSLSVPLAPFFFWAICRWPPLSFQIGTALVRQCSIVLGEGAAAAVASGDPRVLVDPQFRTTNSITKFEPTSPVVWWYRDWH